MVAAKAVEAAQAQQIALPGEKRAAKLVCDLAHQLLSNAQDLRIGLGLDAKGVPSRVIDSKVTE